MTVTYDLTNNIGKVRLKIGDTDTTDSVFTDEEITIFLTNNSNNVNLSSAEAMEAWAAKYATNADSEHIGDYSYTQKIVANMMKTAERLRETEASIPDLDWAEMNLTGEEDDE